jgi:predicted ATP-grasp superfamily ATP-dependent carboligase
MIGTNLAQRVVLFGEAGTALSAAWCLRAYPITVISAPDEPRLASYSRFIQERIRLKDRTPGQICECLERLHIQREQLFLFPCSDAWIEALSFDLERTLEFGRMLPQSRAHVAITLDKIEFGKQIQANGLPGPEVFCFKVQPDWKPPQYPFVLKPVSTYRFEDQHGVKALHIRTPEQWQALDKSLLCANSFLAQEFLVGPSISVCFCSTRDGRLAVAYATEKIHFGSMRGGSRVATVVRPDAIDLAANFVRNFQFVGFGELEMIDSPRGLALIELNARPWSQVLMSTVLGMPILELSMRLMQDEDPSLDYNHQAQPLEWIAWDSDLLFQLVLRKSGRPIRPPSSFRRVYAISFQRDPLPAFVHALAFSRLGPARFLSHV